MTRTDRIISRDENRPGPGWNRICHTCLGCTIDWPDTRRCICAPSPAEVRKKDRVVNDAAERLGLLSDWRLREIVAGWGALLVAAFNNRT